jgi:hypothetical protein
VKPQATKTTMTEKLVYNVAKNEVVLSWANWDIPLMVK